MVNIIGENALERKKKIRLRICCGILISFWLLFIHAPQPSSPKYQPRPGLPAWRAGRMALHRQCSECLLPLPISLLVTLSWLLQTRRFDAGSRPNAGGGSGVFLV